MKRSIKRIMSAVCAAALLVIPLAACGFEAEQPTNSGETAATYIPAKPLYEPDDSQVGEFTASDFRFKLSRVERKEGSPLAGKTIYWLGSSVTDGQNAEHISTAEFLDARTGSTSVKEAVSGTTILDIGRDDGGSYTYRLVNGEHFDKNATIDAFICQISTNDAKSENLDYWGTITDADMTDMDAFDLSTSIGGVEYIIAYVTEIWHCPVYFYSGAYFGDEGLRSNSDPAGSDYGRFIDAVTEVAEKWNTIDGYTVEVIDLYHDEAFNAQASDAYYEWCMADAIHPKAAGFLQWWMPYIEEFLSERLG